MELSYLYYFKIVAETENISRAATELHISQPALSKAVSKLEAGLGVSLFQRKKGRISLTPIGREYYTHINRAFASVEDGQRIIDEYRRSMDESVTIGSPVGELLSSFILDYLGQPDSPEIAITQLLYDPEVLKEELLEGNLDFAITPIPLPTRELEQTKLMDEEIFVVVSREHPFADRKTVCLSELKDERFLINEASFDLQVVTDHCALAGFQPKITLCSNEAGIITEALEANRGISLVPGNVVYSRYRKNGSIQRVSVLRIADVDVTRFISVARRKDRLLGDNAKTLYRSAVKYYTELGNECREFFADRYPEIPGQRKSLYIKELDDERADLSRYGLMKSNRKKGSGADIYK